MTTRPPRVVFVVPELDRVGGYELQALALGEALAAHGVSIWVLTNAQPGSPLPAREFQRGVWIYRLRAPTYPRALLPPWKWSRRQWSQRSLEDELVIFLRNHAHRYDAVHGAAFAYPCDVAVRTARQLGKPSLVKVATLDDPTELAELASAGPPFQQNWQNLLQAEHLLCISRAIADEFRSLGVSERQLRMIPNGVDAGLYHPPCPVERHSARERLQLEERTLAFVFVGRLTHRKAVDVLLEAWLIFTQQRPHGMTLLIVGDGEEDARLRQLTKLAGLESSVRFLGMRHDVAELLRAGDVFVLPSCREGLSNALLQAMSTGLPAVATRIGGNVDLIDEGTNGLLCASDDALELAACLERMAADPAFRRHAGAAARQSILRHYAFPCVIEQLLPLYGITTAPPVSGAGLLVA